jgi:predicted ATP-grasp superfamily ATP-dependent carboligase
VNVLVTASRMPFALDEIRKLGRGGHTVYAADTLATAPGSRSRFVRERFRVTPPARAPLEFIAEVKQIVLSRAVGLLVPGFEEIFYLARHLPELSEVVEVLSSPFPLLARLHDKAAFAALASDLGVPTPATTVVAGESELREVLRWYPRHVARPVYSRGGIELYANAGPLAGAVAVEDCHPSPERPWIVQEYIDGRDLCTFSVARRGRLVLHCTYIHPLEMEHRGGIVFESIDDPEAASCVRRLVEASGFHGQLGVDFRRDGRDLYALECNPRPTAGVHLTTAEELTEALVGGARARVRVVPAGRRRQYASAVLRDLLLHGSHLRADAHWLFARDADDVYGEPGDPVPGLFQVLSWAQLLAFRLRHRAPARGTGLMAAYFDGITWDGQDIP